MGIIIVLLFFVAAWFLLIRPRQQELRRHQALIAQLAPGDEVVTSSGVYGTIRTIEGDIVQLEVAPGLELKLAKRAIATIAVPPAPVIDAGSVVDLTSELDEADEAEPPSGPDRPDVAGA